MTEYEILIKNKAGEFVASDTCNGALESVYTSRTCLVSYAELIDPLKFDLDLNDPIEVKIRGKNEIGFGLQSHLTDGDDVVRTKPLKPPTIIQEGPLTDDSQIHILWDALTGLDTGLDSIIEYEVYWDNGSSG